MITPDKEVKNVLLIAGIVIVVFSSLAIGFLNFSVFYLLGIPLIPLLVGIILIWSSRAGLRYKLICTALPIPLVVLGFLSFIQILPKGEPETFLIHDSFRGQFEVIFDEKCGTAIDYENRRRVYKIPESGIAIVSGSRTMGVMDREFLLVDSVGNRNEIPVFHWSDYSREIEDWQWLLSFEKPNRETVGIHWAYQIGFSFFVSNYNEFDINKEQKEERSKEFRRLRDEALKTCRNRTN